LRKSIFQAEKIDFSDIFQSLSLTIVPQVWLTRITLQNFNHDIILSGNSYSEQQFELFIQNLSNDKNFSSYSLNVNKLERISEKEKLILEFEVKLTEKLTT